MDCSKADPKPGTIAQRLIGLLVLILLVASSGCGTRANLVGKDYPLLGDHRPETTRPFGGVGRDLRWITTVTVPVNVIFLADLPVSLVGDLVTLPKVRKIQRSTRPYQIPSSDDELVPIPPERQDDAPLSDPMPTPDSGSP
jgi:hypothetical protein